MENIQQHIDNLLNSKIGKVKSKIVLENMTRSGHYDKMLQAAKEVNKKPVQLIKNDEVVYEFDSSVEAAEFLGVHPKTIQGALNGRYKTCKGYVLKKK